MDNENEERCADTGWQLVENGQCAGCLLEDQLGPCVVE